MSESVIITGIVCFTLMVIAYINYLSKGGEK